MSSPDDGLCSLHSRDERLLIEHLQTGLSRILSSVFGAGFVDIAFQWQTAVDLAFADRTLEDFDIVFGSCSVFTAFQGRAAVDAAYVNGSPQDLTSSEAGSCSVRSRDSGC